MSDMSATSIHRVGPYNPTRRPVQGPQTPPYVVLPSVPVPQFPAMPPVPQMPPVGSYPSYPSQPSYPTQPSYPSYPQQPSYPQYPQQPGYPQYPQRGVGAFIGDMWTGVKERSHEIGQFIAHPINGYARRPYMGRNPYQPRTSGEIAGRWLVNGVLIVGAFLGGRALIGAGGGAGVGSSGFLSRAAQVIAAPFQWAGRAIGSAVGAVSNAIGGMLSGLFGGARVGFR